MEIKGCSRAAPQGRRRRVFIADFSQTSFIWEEQDENDYLTVSVDLEEPEFCFSLRITLGDSVVPVTVLVTNLTEPESCSVARRSFSFQENYFDTWADNI
ncbi:hypothetical protein AVEN_70195-1 [Araneus ventricosus]|uniref:Uncharacterized protein n=1 Tax=Araneus ventricosus TaxID=182803 RepID=A0A4Y2FEU9_ARAVE|nr:hypothetical protein AVEN_70195-1 [Araneus ventricosus]